MTKMDVKHIYSDDDASDDELLLRPSGLKQYPTTTTLVSPTNTRSDNPTSSQNPTLSTTEDENAPQGEVVSDTGLAGLSSSPSAAAAVRNMVATNTGSNTDLANNVATFTGRANVSTSKQQKQKPLLMTEEEAIKEGNEYQ
jgi:hypothetical protein